MKYSVTKKTPKVVEEEITTIEIEFPLVFKTSFPGVKTYYKITKEDTKFHCMAAEEDFITGNKESDMTFSFAVLRANGFEEFVLENETSINRMNKEEIPKILEMFDELLEDFKEKLKK